MEVGRISKLALVAMFEPDPEDREKKVLVEYLLGPNTQKKVDEILKGRIS